MFKYITYFSYTITILLIIILSIYGYFHYKRMEFQSQFIEDKIYNCNPITMIDFKHSTIRKVKGRVQLINTGRDIMMRGGIETESPFNKIYISISDYEFTLRDGAKPYYHLYILRNAKAVYKIILECK